MLYVIYILTVTEQRGTFYILDQHKLNPLPDKTLESTTSYLTPVYMIVPLAFTF